MFELNEIGKTVVLKHLPTDSVHLGIIDDVKDDAYIVMMSVYDADVMDEEMVIDMSFYVGVWEFVRFTR